MHLCRLVFVWTLLVGALAYEDLTYGSLGGLGEISSPVGLLGGALAYGDGGHSFDAAIHSKRTVSVVPVHEHYEEPKINAVSVDAAEMPLVLTLKSKSSPLIVNAVHLGSEKGSIKKTKSVDAPHIRVHETLKPVLQEVREIVQPKRQITQMISPMVQKINTLVSAHGGGGGGGYGGGYGGGGGGGGGYGGYGGHGGYVGPGHYGGGGIEGGLDGGYNAGLDFGHVLDYGGGAGGGAGLAGGGSGGGGGGYAGDYEGYGKGELLGGYSRGIHKIASLHKKSIKGSKKGRLYY